MDKLGKMAHALAASIQPHLGQPTLPPRDWAQTGEIVTVILADGRKVSASISDINKLMFSQGVQEEMPKSKPTSPYPVKVKAPPSPKPAAKGGAKKK